MLFQIMTIHYTVNGNNQEILNFIALQTRLVKLTMELLTIVLKHDFN